MDHQRPVPKIVGLAPHDVTHAVIVEELPNILYWLTELGMFTEVDEAEVTELVHETLYHLSFSSRQELILSVAGGERARLEKLSQTHLRVLFACSDFFPLHFLHDPVLDEVVKALMQCYCRSWTTNDCIGYFLYYLRGEEKFGRVKTSFRKILDSSGRSNDPRAYHAPKTENRHLKSLRPVWKAMQSLKLDGALWSTITDENDLEEIMVKLDVPDDVIEDVQGVAKSLSTFLRHKDIALIELRSAPKDSIKKQCAGISSALNFGADISYEDKDILLAVAQLLAIAQLSNSTEDIKAVLSHASNIDKSEFVLPKRNVRKRLIQLERAAEKLKDCQEVAVSAARQFESGNITYGACESIRSNVEEIIDSIAFSTGLTCEDSTAMKTASTQASSLSSSMLRIPFRETVKALRHIVVESHVDDTISASDIRDQVEKVLALSSLDEEFDELDPAILLACARMEEMEHKERAKVKVLGRHNSWVSFQDGKGKEFEFHDTLSQDIETTYDKPENAIAKGWLEYQHDGRKCWYKIGTGEEHLLSDYGAPKVNEKRKEREKEKEKEEEEEEQEKARDEDVDNANEAIWEEHLDPNSGAMYYYNRATGQSRWEKPVPIMAREETSGMSPVNHGKLKFNSLAKQELLAEDAESDDSPWDPDA